ncbi:MAG: hypothetical protein A2007_05945 [Verrucomicrobia bacterium GWC2_42_7]|nr:MAG: hypothetical protein A2007_05945 [Verrucomicrobia bacterium GWC2_42_7]
MDSLENISTGILYGKASQAQDLVNSKTLTESQKIKTACQLFEGTLFRQILSDSLKPMIKGYMDESGSMNEIYRSFVTDSLSAKMSESGSLGIGNLLQAQLQHRVSKNEPTK